MFGQARLARIEGVLAGTPLIARREWLFGVAPVICLYCKTQFSPAKVLIFRGSGADAERAASRFALVFQQGVNAGFFRLTDAIAERLSTAAPEFIDSLREATSTRE